MTEGGGEDFKDKVAIETKDSKDNFGEDLVSSQSHNGKISQGFL